MVEDDHIAIGAHPRQVGEAVGQGVPVVSEPVGKIHGLADGLEEAFLVGDFGQVHPVHGVFEAFSGFFEGEVGSKGHVVDPGPFGAGEQSVERECAHDQSWMRRKVR